MLKKVKKSNIGSALKNIIENPLKAPIGSMSVSIIAEDKEGLEKGLDLAKSIAGKKMELPSFDLEDTIKGKKKKEKKE